MLMVALLRVIGSVDPPRVPPTSAELKVATSFVATPVLVPGNALPAQLVVVNQSALVAPFQVWLVACTEPESAKRPTAESDAALAMLRRRRAAAQRGISVPIGPEQMESTPRRILESGRGAAEWGAAGREVMSMGEFWKMEAGR